MGAVIGSGGAAGKHVGKSDRRVAASAFRMSSLGWRVTRPKTRDDDDRDDVSRAPDGSSPPPGESAAARMTWRRVRLVRLAHFNEL